MANGFMVINSRFKPFSYEEMLRPVAAYTDEYNAQEAAYGELANNASQWEKLKDSAIDQDVYQRYKDYSTNLQSAADRLSSEGLKPGGRKALIDARNQYTQQIVPIEQAYQKRSELAKMQREMRAKDPTTLIERGADEIGLSELISNPELSPATYSGAYLENSARQAALALAKEIRENPKEWESILGGQYYESRAKYGYTADEINAAINGSPDAPPELVQVIDQVMQPVINWQNPQTVEAARGHVARGMWSAIGEEKYQNLDNWYAKMMLQEQQYRTRKKNEDEASASKLFPTRSIKVASPSETIKATQDMTKSISRTLEKGKLYFENGYVQSVGGAPYTKMASTDLFDSEGRLRSKEAVLRDGTTEGEKAAIAKAYDSISQELSFFGISPEQGTAYTRKDIEDAMLNMTYENSPTAMNFEELLLEPEDAQTVVAAQIQRSIDGDKKFVRGLRKIKSWDKEGNLTFDDRPVKVEDVVTTDEKTKKVSTNEIPQVLASHNINIPGQIIKIGGTMYYMAPSEFGNQGEEMSKRQRELAQMQDYVNTTDDSEESMSELDRRRSNYVRSLYAPYLVHAKKVGIAPFRSNQFTTE